MTLTNLYAIADRNNIDVDYFPFKGLISMSAPGMIAINTDKLETVAEETVHLSHELGHCMTGSFYRIDTLETRGRMEERANRWAYKTVLPLSELQEALRSGITQAWELAEYFDLPQKFIEKALYYYRDALGSLVA